MKSPIIRTGLGQASHRFLGPESFKPCIIGGLHFEEHPGLAGDSDGDVVLHAICNAISSLTGVPILGGVANDLFKKDGITDSQVYLDLALKTLGSQTIQHIALSIEGKRPRLQEHLPIMREKLASLLHLTLSQVGITAISGDGLTDFGCGDGLHCLCLLTTSEFANH